MIHWTETCPYCKTKFPSSGKSYGTPLVVCSKCHKAYIQPGRTELGLIPKERWKMFKFREMIKPSFYIAFLCFAVSAVVYGLSARYIPNFGLSASYIFIATVVLAGVFIPVFIKKHSRYIDKQLKLSNERLCQPGYRQILISAGYKPRHL